MAEIARCESELRKGNLDMEGALQGLQDWSGELRIVEETDKAKTKADPLPAAFCQPAKLAPESVRQCG